MAKDGAWLYCREAQQLPNRGADPQLRQHLNKPDRCSLRSKSYTDSADTLSTQPHGFSCYFWIEDATQK